MKNRSSDYIDGLVDYYLMVIEVLCIIVGIVGCALGDCNFFVFLSRRGSFGLDGLYVCTHH